MPSTETDRKANTKPAARRTSPAPPRILFSNGLLAARRILELRRSSAGAPAHSRCLTVSHPSLLVDRLSR
jgi:hypothetical protein